MAIANVVQIQPRLDRFEEFLSRVGEFKKVIERLGARVRVRTTVAGGAPNSVAFISEVDDWATYGDFSAKLEADAEYQRLLARERTDPVAEITGVVLVQDVPLP